LLGVPWALAFAEEQQMVEMEKEMKMRDMGGEVCASNPLTGFQYFAKITDSLTSCLTPERPLAH
jgi:hypothetical protein